MHMPDCSHVVEVSICPLLLLVNRGCTSLLGWVAAVMSRRFKICRRVIENAMQNLKGTAAEGRVSYADLIALGGAYAVQITGGPSIDLSIGRLTVCKVQFSLNSAKWTPADY